LIAHHPNFWFALDLVSVAASNPDSAIFCPGGRSVDSASVFKVICGNLRALLREALNWRFEKRLRAVLEKLTDSAYRL